MLTAAHCAYDERNNAFAKDWIFIPDYQLAPTRSCDQTAYGCWTTVTGALVVPQGYADQDTFNDAATRRDFAFAIVGPGGMGGNKQLDKEVGSFPITFSAVDKLTEVLAFGYPAAKKYKGTKLTYCQGPIFYDAGNDNKTYGLTCDMTGGSSGGPWFTGFSSGTGTQASLNSYGYRGSDAMFGPKFNTTTGDVFDKADGATGDQLVP